MAVVTSAVVAAIGTGYGIYSSEEQKQQARLAGQEADRQKAKIEGQKKTQKKRQEAERARDTAVMRQKAAQAGGQQKDQTLLGGAIPGGTVGGGQATTKLGETNSGKTLLGV